MRQLNAAATLLRLERFREAALAADAVLWRSNGARAKAWFRRGTALLALGEFNEAAADLEQARRREPSDKAILAAVASAAKERERAGERESSRTCNPP